MKKYLTLFLTIFLLSAFASNVYAYAPDSSIDTQSMMDTIRILSSNPRGIKNTEIEYARQYIIKTFKSYNLNVSTQSFQTSLTDSCGNPYTAVNIIGSILPKAENKTDDILIIGAHYDGANDFPAANDNGSGIAVMFEMIRLLHDVPTDTEIRFVAFDAEEPGLVGSEYYAQNLGSDRENVIGMLNFDMLAGKKDGEVSIDTINGNTNYLFELLRQDSNYSHIQPHKQEVGISDHQSFFSKQIPILYFEHPAIMSEIHKATDTIDTISPDMLLFATDAGLTLTKQIMSEDTPSFKETAHPAMDNAVYTIQKKMRLPLHVSPSEFEEETGIKLNQISSSDGNTIYNATVRLLNMKETYTITAYDSGTNDSISQLFITLSDSTAYESIKSAMTKAWGKAEHSGDSYIWHNIYGNTYILTQSRLQFYPYSLKDEENYTVSDGKLTHIEYYPVTDIASRVWERIKPLLSPEEIDSLSSVKITTDGIGGFLSVAMSLSGSDLHMDVDYADILNADGSCYNDDTLKKTLEIAYAICTNKSGAPDSWAKNDMIEAMKEDILPEDMAYGFTDNITRLDFCKIAYNLLKDKITEVNTSSFTDVNSEAVNALAGINIISGRDDEHFAPNDVITREEAAVILSNIAEYIGLEATSDKIFIYADDKSISPWASDNVYRMRNLGIMSGMEFNKFSPQNKYTKQDAVATLMRIYSRIKE